MQYLLHSSEFWSAITGAAVGGLIAFGIQTIVLREAKKQRADDHNRVQQGLANSLLFKLMRVHSNFKGIQRHIDECFEEAKKKGFQGEPWQFFLPLANPPSPVHFSSEEMGMLLAQKNDEVFNSVLSMDVVHNSLIEAVKVLNDRRAALAERLTPEAVDGQVVGGVLPKKEMLALRPRMIEVNSLIELLRQEVANDFAQSGEVLDRTHQLLRDRLGLSYKLQSNQPDSGEGRSGG